MRNQTSYTYIIVLLSIFFDVVKAQHFEPALPPVPIGSVDQILIKQQEESVTMTKITTPKVSTALSSPPIRLSSGMLINIRHPWTPTADNVYVLNAGYTWGKIERRLFADDNMNDMEALYLDTNPDNAVSFHVDPYWQRIVYFRKSGNWIRSYGDAMDQRQLVGPRAIAVDINDTIYVANTEANNIVKLWFDRNDNGGKLKFVTSFTVSGMSHPVDIAIDQRGTLAGNPANDRIWIADDFGRKLIEIDRRGVIQRQITNCDPWKVQTQEIGGRLAYIDRVQNAFIVKSLSSLSTIASTSFNPASSSLSCIGQDINNEWWVGDEKMKMYHKFTESGQYLASYNGIGSPSGQFASPVAISKAPYYKSGGTIYRSQYIFTSDRWGDNTGLRAYMPGVEVLDFDYHSESMCEINYTVTLTNKAYVKGTLYRRAGLYYVEPIHEYDFGMKYAGENIVSIDRYYMDSGYYKLTLRFWPTHFNLSYDLPKDSIEKWINISYIHYYYPYIQPVPSDRTCFSNEQGRWRVMPCEGNFSYRWFIRDQISNWNWQWVGNNNRELTLSVGDNRIELKCEVTHTPPGGGAGTVYESGIYTNCAPSSPPPCPFVFTFNGTKFSIDNNILPQSFWVGNERKDVTDYYKLSQPPQQLEDEYVLKIIELHQDRTIFDQVQLHAIDHNRATEIAVVKTGEIVQYISPYGLTSAKIKGRDVTRELDNVDSLSISVQPGDTLIFSFRKKPGNEKEISSVLEEGGMVVEASVPGKEDPRIVPPDDMPKIAGDSLRDRNVNSSVYRHRPALIFIPFSRINPREMRLVANGEATLGYASIALKIPASYWVQELVLTSASHSSHGDVREKLLSIDDIYTEVGPSDTLELRFSSEPVPMGKQRSFIFTARGRTLTVPDKFIEPQEQISLPNLALTEFKLHPNIPNPFNPIATISYQIAEECNVHLAVYDVLGREVAVLVNEQKLPGVYTVTWDARNSASGLYFYRLTAGKFTDVKKMLLIR